MTLHNREVRQDVRELGTVLGDVLEAQTSRRSYDTVERCRQAAIGYRRDDAETREALIRELVGLSPDEQRTVARAFTTYFELVNLVEERQRVRKLRTAADADTLTDGLETAAAALAEVDQEIAEEVLQSVHIQPTFTAHPTEARRKTVKTKLRAVATHLEILDERTMTATEMGRVWRDLESEVTSLWQTPQVRKRQPAPIDEARNVRWYLENTLFDVIPEVYDGLETAIDSHSDGDLAVPPLVSLRSWAGSDRDGNPYVTPEVTAQTLEDQRDSVLERYQAELKRLSGILSQDGSRILVGDDFAELHEADRERLPGVARTADDRYPGEPYRQQLKLMRERLDRVGGVRPGGYRDADDLEAALEIIADSLRDNDAETVAAAHVDPVRRLVQTFGFTLAPLDIREHQAIHTAAIDEALDIQGIDYASMTESERVEWLTAAIEEESPILDLTEREDLSADTVKLFDLFDRLADWQASYGVSAVGTYCISMTDEPSHVLEVLFLADQAGIVSLPEHSGLDIVPLLETERALDEADRIMTTLFDNRVYAQAVRARSSTQEVMLGYSDSNKENGFLAANWDLHRTQRVLGAVCADHDVRLRLFHGRGGWISRGGGPMSDALLALPTSTITGPVKFTEQGEAIAEKYGNPRIAERNLEQMISAQLRARLQAVRGESSEVKESWLEAMDAMAEASRTAYRGLLDTEGFVRYFEQATPISVIEDLDLGSRPASRTGERTVEDLRSIPWVFSWTQCRCILPGWFALGTGIEAALDEGAVDMATLQEMYADWPFFRTTLDNAALALSRTDLEIAAEYAALADDDLTDFFERLAGEYELAADLVTEIGDRDQLHTSDWLGENLERRNPYVDPLNLLQAHLLGRTHRTEIEERTLRLTVKGIAAGMKNTG